MFTIFPKRGGGLIQSRVLSEEAELSDLRFFGDFLTGNAPHEEDEVDEEVKSYAVKRVLVIKEYLVKKFCAKSSLK